MLGDVLLSPFRLILRARHRLYDKGVKKSYSASVPTICIGNVSVGGTGKTPHTEMVLRLLQESPEWSGKNIAVLSLGYGRKGTAFREVKASDSASLTGDEPLQIKGKFPSVTVAVDKSRVEGCDILTHPEKLSGVVKGAKATFPPADVIILDDAFQYRKLRPTVSIVLIDYSRPLDKDGMLPFGTLRDVPERVYEADMVIITKCPSELSLEERKNWLKSMGVSDYDMGSCSGKTPKGKTFGIFFSTIGYCAPEGVYGESDNRFLYSKNVILFTGIAKSDPLRRYLSDTYKIIGHLRFADHHRFGKGDLARIMRSVRSNPTALVATTEKDSRRILDCKGIPLELKERLFHIPIEAKFLTYAEKEKFEKGLLSLIGKGQDTP